MRTKIGKNPNQSSQNHSCYKLTPCENKPIVSTQQRIWDRHWTWVSSTQNWSARHNGMWGAWSEGVVCFSASLVPTESNNATAAANYRHSWQMNLSHTISVIFGVPPQSVARSFASSNFIFIYLIAFLWSGYIKWSVRREVEWVMYFWRMEILWRLSNIDLMCGLGLLKNVDARNQPLSNQLMYLENRFFLL